MRRLWWLAALAVAAYVVFLLVTLPASFVLARMEPLGVHAAGVAGTAWRGQAQVVQVGSLQLGRVDWDLHALPLFLGRLQADVKLTHPSGFAQTVVTARPGGSIELRDLTGSLPVSALPPNLVRGQWNGTVNLRFAALLIEEGWPAAAAGTLEVLDLTSQGANLTRMGSYAVTFPPAAGASPDGVLQGALSDLGGPLQIAGTLELRPDRSYLLDGLVAVRPEAPQEMANALQFLGEPDARGRRPFRLEGTM